MGRRIASLMMLASLLLPGCIIVLDGDPVTASGGDRFSEVERIDVSVGTGTLRFRAEDVEEVQVAWLTESAESNPATVQARVVGGELKVREQCDPLSFAMCEANITVLVPLDWSGAVVASTSDGDVEAVGLQGELSLATARGQLSADDVGGTVSLLANDGVLRIRGSEGTLTAEVVSGRLDASGVRGDRLSFKVSSGELDASVDGGQSSELPTRVEVVLRSSDGELKLPGVAWDVDEVTIEAELNLEGIQDEPDAPALLWVEAIDSTLLVRAAED